MKGDDTSCGNWPPAMDEMPEGRDLATAAIADSALGPGLGSMVLGAVAVFCAATAFAAIWLYPRVSPGAAFGLWQGPFLAEEPIQRLPLLSRQFFALAAAHIPGNAAWRLNILTALAGAVACGLLAVGAYAAALRVSGLGKQALGWAILAGAGAGALWATSTPFTGAATAASPATLTALLALASLAGLFVFLTSRDYVNGLYLSAIAAGLATANHPAMAWLGPLVLVVGLLRMPVSGASARRLAIAMGVFAMPAAIPLLHALNTGETLEGFLAHALQAPYPAPGDGRPDLGFATELTSLMPWPALGAAALGLLLFFYSPARPLALVLAGVVLAMGPLYPVLTNQFGADTVLRDEGAPRLLVMAALATGTALALALLGRGVGDRLKRPGLGMALLAVLAAATVWSQARVAPSRNSTAAESLARKTLECCPEGALLVSGHPAVTSLLEAVQAAEGCRTDVALLPSVALVDPGLRERLHAAGLPGVCLDRFFPSDAAWERWEHERPLVLAEAKRDRDSGHALARGLSGRAELGDLAVWDVVRQNYARRPICFAGVSAPWLAARGQPRGLVVAYPRPAGSETSLDIDEGLAASLKAAKPPLGLDETLPHLLAPLSGCARAQGLLDEAVKLAEYAVDVSGGTAETRLALVRAEARAGHGPRALACAAAYWETAPGAGSDTWLEDFIAEDLERFRLAEGFLETIRLGDESGGRVSMPEEMAEALWMADELAVLEQGYASVVAANPEDGDAAFQLAAVYAQRGELQLAQQMLKAYAERSDATATRLAARLAEDGRFALLKEFTGTARPDDGGPGGGSRGGRL